MQCMFVLAAAVRQLRCMIVGAAAGVKANEVRLHREKAEVGHREKAEVGHREKAEVGHWGEGGSWLQPRECE